VSAGTDAGIRRTISFCCVEKGEGGGGGGGGVMAGGEGGGAGVLLESAEGWVHR